MSARCVLCGTPCIPMADYDRTVCHGCDGMSDAMLTRARYEPATLPTPRLTPGQLALQEAARLEAAKVYGRVVPEHHNAPSGLAAAVAEAELTSRLRLIEGGAA